jgi:hypothetical protein
MYIYVYFYILYIYIQVPMSMQMPGTPGADVGVPAEIPKMQVTV